MRCSKLRFIVCLYLFLQVWQVSSQIQKKKATVLNDQVDQLFSAWDSDKSPGLAVLLVKDGAILYKKGYGMANLEYGIPISTSTIFDIASLSKQFTGYAISYLVENGKISLDDDIRKYIPELPDFGHKITIGHLVHHTSGLRDWPGTLAIKGRFMDDVISFDEILSMAYSQEDLNFIPGSEYSYSNTGYNILAELVQRITGESFRRWTETNIFRPLGMLNTHFHDDHTEIVQNKANGYFFKDDSFHVNPNNLTALGSSSLYTTIDDFAKWTNSIMKPKGKDIPIINRMKQQGVLNNGKEISYAFGVHMGEYGGRDRMSHTGSWASFKTYSGYYLKDSFAIVIFSNDDSFKSTTMANKISDIYFGNKIEIDIKDPITNDEKEIFSVDLDNFIGKFYSEELQTEYEFVVQDNKLIAKNNRSIDIEMTPAQTDRFEGNTWFFHEVKFLRNGNNDIIGFKVSNGRVRNLMFKKINGDHKR